MLRRQHIQGLTRAMFKAIQTDTTLRCLVGQGKIEEGITAAIEANMAIERELNAQADQLLDQQLKRAGAHAGDDLNLEKARQLIKKELAKKRGFVL